GGSSSFVACDQFRELGLIAFGGGCPADFPHSVVSNQSLVGTPTLAIPSEPLSQTGDIAQGVLMLVDKAQRQRIVTECRRPDFLRSFAVLAERDNFSRRLFTFVKIHMTISLAPIIFAAGVIIVRRLAPAFVRPAHLAASCSCRTPKRRKRPQSDKCSMA